MTESLLRRGWRRTSARRSSNARRFPGVLDVAITPDAHHGYGVPVGCVMATGGTLAMGPVGYDIGCGMRGAALGRSRATRPRPERVKDFSRLVMQRRGAGRGRARAVASRRERFQEIVRGGAEALGAARGTAERDRIPVDDAWDIPKDSRAWRGQNQLGSLGGGNHFIELQHDGERLWVMFHTGSRGFGHGLATHYFEQAQGRAGPRARTDGPRLLHARVAALAAPTRTRWRAGGNYAIVNRLLIGRAGGGRFRRDVRRRARAGLRDQPQPRAGGAAIPTSSRIRCGSTARARRARCPPAIPCWPARAGQKTGHPVLIPGSMGDSSYVLRPLPGAARCLYSVNHGCGRRKSRAAARREITPGGGQPPDEGPGRAGKRGRRVPIDESPDCYKPAEEVIRAVTEAGLAEVEVAPHADRFHQGQRLSGGGLDFSGIALLVLTLH